MSRCLIVDFIGGKHLVFQICDETTANDPLETVTGGGGGGGCFVLLLFLSLNKNETWFWRPDLAISGFDVLGTRSLYITGCAELCSIMCSYKHNHILRLNFI